MQVLKDADYGHMDGKINRNRKLALVSILVGIILLFFISIFPLAIFGFIITLFIALGFLNRNFSWKKGKLGEKKVANVLKKLGDSYYLLNDVSLSQSGGNIDHIVLGPNGIFVIETKNYSGDVGCKKDDWYLLSYSSKKRFLIKRRSIKKPIPSISKQVNKNKTALKNFIEKRIRNTNLKNHQIDVKAIIVFVKPDIELKLRKPTVPVLRLSKLPKFIKKAKTESRFSDDELKVISDIVLKYSKG